MALVLQTSPAIEPITLDELKSHLRIDTASEDDFLKVLISSSRRNVERMLSRTLITTIWDLWLDHFPVETRQRGDGSDWWDGVKEGPITMVDHTKRYIELPRSPVQSVTHLKTFDDNDNETTFSSSNYFVDTASDPGRLVLNDGQTWPTDDLRSANGINVQYVAGYGSNEGDVPEDIRVAIKMIAAHYYENRGDSDAKFPKTALHILQPYQIRRL
jgi:hypothetical protein